MLLANHHPVSQQLAPCSPLRSLPRLFTGSPPHRPGCLSSDASSDHQRQRNGLRIVSQAAKGFGSTTSRKPKKRKRPGGGVVKEGDEDWIAVAKLKDFKSDRPTLPVELKDKSTVMLYQIDGEVYCTDAMSTAFKFPLTNAKIIEGEDGPAVEVALDGTIYDLETGKVLKWCPKNNPIRSVLGAIKGTSSPEDLKTYPAWANDDGVIYVKFR